MEDQLVQKLSSSIPMQTLRCAYHKPANIGKVCSDVTCDKKPLMCSKCAIEDVGLHREHSNKIIDLDCFITSFSSEMFRVSDSNKRLYDQFSQGKENVELLLLLESGEIHLKSVEDKVYKQKLELASDMSLLQEHIQLILQQIKDESQRKLDNFLFQYKQAFNSLKANIDSFFLLSRKNYFYSNSNSMQFKLASLPSLEAQSFIKTLKHHLNLSKTLRATSSTPLQILSDLQTLASFLQKMSGSPPNYDKMSSSDYQGSKMQTVVREVGQLLSSVISGRLFVPVDGLKDTCEVGTGDHSTQIQLDARNSEELKSLLSFRFYFEPSKKYQLDFPIQSVFALTESIFVMGSSSDALIRIFDSQAKKISIYQGHDEPITYLENILTENNSKQFVSLSTDKQLIVWYFNDISTSIVPKIIRRILLASYATSVLDMKDQNHLAIFDVTGDISVVKMSNSKVGNYCKTAHHNPANGLVLLKIGERFISYSSNSIINIWRIMKVEASQEPLLVCDLSLCDINYGTISQIFITTQWKDQAVIVNTEGDLKIFDLTKNCVVFSQNCRRKLNPILIESIMIEEADRILAPTNWIMTFSYDDNVAVQHRLTNSPFNMYSQDVRLEHKLISKMATSVKHKIQLFRTNQQVSESGIVGNAKLGSMMVMFASEANQELLIYELKGK